MTITQKQHEDMIQVGNRYRDGERNMTEHCNPWQINPGDHIVILISIQKLKNYEKPKKTSYPKSKYKPLKGSYPGEFVEIDVKYVPLECIGFKSYYEHYYQITRTCGANGSSRRRNH